MKTETSQQNIKDKEFRYVNSQEIRERKPIKPNNQDHQNSPFSSSSLTTKYKNIFHQFCNKLSLQSHNVIIGMIFVLIIVIICNNMPRNVKPHPIFEDFNPPDKMMECIVSCRRTANMIQKSVAFEPHSCKMATELRNFGDKIKEAGHSLQNMCSKGSLVYHSFDVEIEAMMNRLNSDYIRPGDAKYFEERLNSLIMKFKEFRELVGKTYISVLDAEDSSNDAEGYMLDGLREAEVFVVKNHCDSAKDNDEKCHSVKVAKKELELVNDILVHLYNAADFYKISRILKYYEDKLIDVSAELESAGVSDEVTKKDLKFLKFSVDDSKLVYTNLFTNIK